MVARASGAGYTGVWWVGRSQRPLWVIDDESLEVGRDGVPDENAILHQVGHLPLNL